VADYITTVFLASGVVAQTGLCHCKDLTDTTHTLKSIRYLEREKRSIQNS